jgi:ABC-2 type transport system ATP-binding protein
VDTPDPAALTAVVGAAGGGTVPAPDGTLTVTGLTAARVGELAYEHRILLRELTARGASLEEAFLAQTAGAVDYLAGESR